MTDQLLLEAVKWVLNDANFRAPEQVGSAAQRWIDRLQDAVQPRTAPALQDVVTKVLDGTLPRDVWHGASVGDIPVEVFIDSTQTVVVRT